MVFANNTPYPDDDWRLPTDYDAAILARLLSVEFPGAPELRRQLVGCQVKQLDGFGSLEFLVAEGEKAEVLDVVPVEGVAADADGLSIHYLLMVRDGILCELDVYTDTTTDMQRLPDPAEIEVKVYDPNRPQPPFEPSAEYQLTHTAISELVVGAPSPGDQPPPITTGPAIVLPELLSPQFLCHSPSLHSPSPQPRAIQDQVAMTRTQRAMLTAYHEFRTSPPTLASLLARVLRSWLLLLVICGGLVALAAAMQWWWVAGIGVGLLVGVVARDIGFCLKTTWVWPVVNQIIDWDRVQQLLAQERAESSGSTGG